MHKRDLHQIHLMAWKRGVKSLYYCRSRSVQRAESGQSASLAAPIPLMGKVNAGDNAKTAVPERVDYEECLACQ